MATGDVDSVVATAVVGSGVGGDSVSLKANDEINVAIELGKIVVVVRKSVRSVNPVSLDDGVAEGIENTDSVCDVDSESSDWLIIVGDGVTSTEASKEV